MNFTEQPDLFIDISTEIQPVFDNLISLESRTLDSEEGQPTSLPKQGVETMIQ